MFYPSFWKRFNEKYHGYTNSFLGGRIGFGYWERWWDKDEFFNDLTPNQPGIPWKMTDYVLVFAGDDTTYQLRQKRHETSLLKSEGTFGNDAYYSEYFRGYFTWYSRNGEYENQVKAYKEKFGDAMVPFTDNILSVIQRLGRDTPILEVVVLPEEVANSNSETNVMSKYGKYGQALRELNRSESEKWEWMKSENQ